MNGLPTPILADIGDWLRLLVPAIFVIIWVISQMLGGGAQKPKPRPRRVQPPRGDGGRPAQGDAGGLSDEIEDFLKKVRQQAGIDEEEKKRPPQPAQQQRQRREPEVVQAELVEPERLRPADPTPPEVKPAQPATPPVGSAASSTPVANQTQDDLASMSKSAEPKRKRRKKKSRRGEKQTSEEEKPAVKVPSTAEEIRKMLTGPKEMRKFVVMSEILNRPEHRW